MERTANPFVSNLQHRQLGILSPMNFSRQTSGSCGLVKRLSLHNKLEHHEGCVNTLHFNMSGDLLASGSDDLDIVIWDWAKGKKKIAYESGHTSNVFQAKFMPYTDTTIVSCARDGKVRVGFLHPSSGEGCKSTKCLAQHKGAAHKLCIQPDSACEFLTCGEDGAVFHADLRDDKAHKLFSCRAEHKRVPLYTIFTNPQNIYEFAVGGRDQFARVYDRRKLPEDNKADVEPIKKYCPHHLMEGSDVYANITCLVYSYNGTELLVSYNDENIYLFDSYSSSEAEYVKTYKGHRNNATVKGVNFYGPQSEYIVSGSDCSHIFLWDKQTEEVVQFLQGDNTGVVNCLEPHPHAPFLATSGLDHDIKLWLPTAEQPTDLDGLENVIRDNDRDREEDRQRPHDPISEHLLWLMMNHIRRRQSRNENGDPDSDDSDLTDDEDDDNDDEDGEFGNRVQCSPS
ncbi:DDB1- and CUL4-associated factor 8 [Acropora cervicornis]|uniref:DDB1- and CUL4-associated factor 8 n=1 Tax=Acropora cervicornis TaxID=6130 RepID=A0AAD9QSR2_ACRCE|nr:DDB1- and CUL4-associated factor 8 [Acropora cervicornis]